MVSAPSPPLIFVFLGESFPKYANENLRLASEVFSGDILLLTTAKDVSPPKTCEIVLVDESWYNSKDFKTFSEQSVVDKLFRGGFWLHAIERFFVLAQFCEARSINTFFHAELDMLILDLDGLAPTLDKFGSGVFLPPEGSHRALASLIYSNSHATFTHMLNFISNNAALGNEMKILGHYLAGFPNRAFALPSDRIFDKDWPFGHTAVGSQAGLVDSSGFGQWLFGPDPRNVAGVAFNRYVSRGLKFAIRELSFRSTLLGNSLWVRQRHQQWLSIRAVHVHSKKFSYLKFRAIRAVFIASANFGVSLPIHLSPGGIANYLVRASLHRKFLPGLTAINVASGGRIAVLLAMLVETSTLVLSGRQQSGFCRIMGVKRISLDSIKNDFSLSYPVVSVDDVVQSAALEDDDLGHFSPEAKVEIILFHFALRLSEPTWITRTEIARLAAGLQRNRGELPVVLGGNKNYGDIRHATAFWGSSTLVRNWNFSDELQLFNPSLVAKMFPGGITEIKSWASLGAKNTVPTFSAFRSYAIWARSHVPTQLICVAKDAAPEPEST